MWICRNEQQRGSGAGGAWLPDAVSSGLPSVSARVDAAVLEEGSWWETHLWVPAELPGGLLYRYWTPVPAWREPVIYSYYIMSELPLLTIAIPPWTDFISEPPFHSAVSLWALVWETEILFNIQHDWVTPLKYEVIKWEMLMMRFFSISNGTYWWHHSIFQVKQRQLVKHSIKLWHIFLLLFICALFILPAIYFIYNKNFGLIVMLTVTIGIAP